MVWQTIITCLILSGAVSLAVTHFYHNRETRKQFEYDYRKHMFEKRKYVYAKIEHIISKNHLVTPEYKTFYSWIDFEKPIKELEFKKYQKLINEVLADNIWLNVPTRECLLKISMLLQDFLDIDKDERQREYIRLHRELRTLFTNDVNILSEYGKFVSDNRYANHGYYSPPPQKQKEFNIRREIAKTIHRAARIFDNPVKS